MSESHEAKKARVTEIAKNLSDTLGWTNLRVILSRVKGQTYKIGFKNRLGFYGTISEYDVICLDLLSGRKGLAEVSEFLDSLEIFDNTGKNMYVTKLRDILYWHISCVSDKEDLKKHKIVYKKSDDARFNYYIPVYDLLLIAHLVNPSLPHPVLPSGEQFFSSKEP